ncbi:MAG: hypothetical protein HY303_07875 [Candidatus Wallbacteria bacterium]|nr:hypothetical protein [Candidatus Wallbacteria bacterium]
MNAKPPLCWLCQQPINSGIQPARRTASRSESSSQTDLKRTNPMLLVGMAVVLIGALLLHGPGFLLALLVLPALLSQLPAAPSSLTESWHGEVDDEDALEAKKGGAPRPRIKGDTLLDSVIDVCGKAATVIGYVAWAAICICFALFVTCTALFMVGSLHH